MEVVGLALTIPTTIDLCFKYGKILLDTCAVFKNADAQVNERVLRIQSYWKRTSVQLEFLQRVWKSLDNEHQEIQVQILQVLNGKLNAVISKLDRQANKKWKYVLMKESLDEAIDELGTWQRMFDPSWFLMLKVSSPFIDQELSKNPSPDSSVTLANTLRDSLRLEPTRKIHVFLPDDELKKARIEEISLASARLIQMAGSDKYQSFQVLI
ncbi:hypothetical protein MMC10_004949 [Thelotrema lepadinum]|nr:hypothetical protein [Thelotrema lepadinum]